MNGYSILEALLLTAALSLDSFFASFAYGASRIKIQLGSVIIISLISSGIFSISLFVSDFISPYISPEVSKYICFAILFLVGLYKLFSEIIKAIVKRGKNEERSLRFNLFNLHFILKINADHTIADKDKNKILSPIEAIPLALALSLDGLGVGISAGLSDISPYILIGFSLILGFASIFMGDLIGRKVTKRLKHNLSFLSGLILIVLAILKII